MTEAGYAWLEATLKETTMGTLAARRERVYSDLAYLGVQTDGMVGLHYSYSPGDGTTRYVVFSGWGGTETLKGLRELEVWVSGAMAVNGAVLAQIGANG